MSCIDKIYSVSALVGSSACNGHCKFCAALPLKNQAGESELYWRNYEAAIKLSARYGGWSLSLTSSGEPTCSPVSVTQALERYNKCAKQGAYFPNVNIFSNGMLLADEKYCKEWLPKWKQLGLTNIAISLHSDNEIEQATVYGVKTYPKFENIFNNVRNYGIGVRGTLLLRKGGIDSVTRYVAAVTKFTSSPYKLDNITSWCIANSDNTHNEFTPSAWSKFAIYLWLRRHAKVCHEHEWGGGVYDYHGNILRLTDYVTKHNPKKNFVRQLVVFQDATVAYSWIREGALCMK